MSDNRLEAARLSIREWIDRPPSVSAVHARTRVLARLEAPAGRSLFPWLTTSWVGAGLALALVLGALWQPARVVDSDPTEPAVRRQRSMVVYELSSGTTLYLTLTNDPVTRPERLGDEP